MKQVAEGSGEQDSLGLVERLNPSGIAWLNAIDGLQPPRFPSMQ